MKDIGKLIRDIRKQQGVTQEELAGISGTGRRFISDVENGKTPLKQVNYYFAADLIRFCHPMRTV